LGITGHYISNDWNLESVMLACNWVTGRHTADNIMMWYEEIISAFGVMEKVKYIVTDSASDVKKAFLTLPGYENGKQGLTATSDDSEAEESDSEMCDTGCNANQKKANLATFHLNIMFVLHMCYS